MAARSGGEAARLGRLSASEAVAGLPKDAGLRWSMVTEGRFSRRRPVTVYSGGKREGNGGSWLRRMRSLTRPQRECWLRRLRDGPQQWLNGAETA